MPVCTYHKRKIRFALHSLLILSRFIRSKNNFFASVVCSVLFAGACTANASESKIQLQGELTQGSLIKGIVQPGTKVKVLDRDVYVDEQGQFIFGLGRDTAPSIQITTTQPNGQSHNHNFTVGQRKYDIQRIEGVAKKYVEPPKEVYARIKREGAQVKKARLDLRLAADFEKGFLMPLEGRITGVYGSQRVFNGVPKRPHYGLDIAGPVGKPIAAPAPGVVTLAEGDLYYSGGTLIIDHGQGVSSTFIHLNKVLVKKGDRIEQGQIIAEVGATGRVTGPHLDWRINWFEQRLDPQLIMDTEDQWNK